MVTGCVLWLGGFALLVEALAGALICAGPFLLAFWRKWMGGGDVKLMALCGLVAGGAAGNLLDRVRSAQGVVDFIDVGIGTHRWPTFNIADMGVSCGAIVLAISLWLEDARRSRAEAAPSS